MSTEANADPVRALIAKWRQTADALSPADPRSYSHAVGLRACADDLEAALAQQAGAVGEVVLFGGDPDAKEVAWAGGKMPAAGTKLYTAPQPAIPEEVVVQLRDAKRLIEQSATRVSALIDLNRAALTQRNREGA